jgi:hypothetical protein
MGRGQGGERSLEEESERGCAERVGGGRKPSETRGGEGREPDRRRGSGIRQKVREGEREGEKEEQYVER